MNTETAEPHYTESWREYPFNNPGERHGYRLFPADLENHPNVFFHGTEERVAQLIFNEGFRIPNLPLAPSVSFSENSSLSLRYAAERRSDESPNGIVIVVRFNSDDRSIIRSWAGGIHVDRFDPQPEVIGYCIVPAQYNYG